MKIKVVDMPYEQALAQPREKHTLPRRPSMLFRALLRANGLREEDYFNADAPLALAANTVSGTLETDGQTQWYRCAVLDESRLPMTLTDKTVLDRMWILRKYISDMNPIEAMNTIHDSMSKTRDNEEFLLSMNS